jgi:hypothetical protein
MTVKRVSRRFVFIFKANADSKIGIKSIPRIEAMLASAKKKNYFIVARI